MAATSVKARDDQEARLQDVPLTERLSLKGKNFLITGGARGIGFACAKAIAQLGGGVAIIDSLPEPVEDFHALANRYNVKTSFVQGDVTNPESLERAFAESVTAIGGQLHGGFTAAGVVLDEKLIDASWAASHRLLDVNVMGTFWSAKLLARHLIETKTPGSIVLTASLSAQGVHVPVSDFAIYNASKAAVKGMVGPLAVELGPHGIRVNSISPGFIVTQMTAGLEAVQPDIFKFYTVAPPAKRVGFPSDLTPMVCYLLSDAASYSTGADHLITGGIHAGRCDPLDLSISTS